MTDRHSRFSLLDAEVEALLSDEIVCGSGMQDASRDPLLSAAAASRR